MDDKQQEKPGSATADSISQEIEALAVRKLAEKFPGLVEEVIYFRGEITVLIPKDKVIEVCTFLRDDPDLRYNMMKDMTGCDYPEREQRFEVIYQLYSLPYNQHIRVKARVGEDEPMPSVTLLWHAAYFQEKEAYDMLGIKFVGHQGLRRILLPEDWEGYPLRKDYPLEGYH